MVGGVWRLWIRRYPWSSGILEISEISILQIILKDSALSWTSNLKQIDIVRDCEPQNRSFTCVLEGTHEPCVEQSFVLAVYGIHVQDPERISSIADANFNS